MTRTELLRDLAQLLRELIPTITDDNRASPDPSDDAPGFQVTIGCNGEQWSYQTGDNSFTGGAYGFQDWGIGYLYRDSDPADVARDIIADLEINGPDWDFDVESELPTADAEGVPSPAS